MATQENPPANLPTPQVNVEFVPAKAGETFKLGTATIRIMEDGSHTGESPPSASSFVGSAERYDMLMGFLVWER